MGCQLDLCDYAVPRQVLFVESTQPIKPTLVTSTERTYKIYALYCIIYIVTDLILPNCNPLIENHEMGFEIGFGDSAHLNTQRALFERGEATLALELWVWTVRLPERLREAPQTWQMNANDRHLTCKASGSSYSNCQILNKLLAPPNEIYKAMPLYLANLDQVWSGQCLKCPLNLDSKALFGLRP